MQVFSARKPVENSVTLVATSILLAITVMQSFSMVDQKRSRWDSLLGDRVSVGGQLGLRIPADWQAVATPGDEMIRFRGVLESVPGSCELYVYRRADAKDVPVREVWQDAVTRLLGAGSRRPPSDVYPMSCRLGPSPAVMVGYMLAGGAGEPHSLAVVASVSASHGTTALMLAIPGSSDSTARALLLRIAASARFDTNASMIEGAS